MKSNDLMYLIGSIVVILGTAMKILHLPCQLGIEYRSCRSFYIYDLETRHKKGELKD